MKIVLLSVAIVMQLQIRRHDMTGAFDMDPIAAVLHLNVLKSNIITAGFFTGGRVSAAVKKETNTLYRCRQPRHDKGCETGRHH